MQTRDECITVSNSPNPLVFISGYANTKDVFYYLSVILCCVVLCCVVLCFVVFCCVLFCFVVLCCVVLCCVVLCCVVLYCITLYCIVLASPHGLLSRSPFCADRII